MSDKKKKELKLTHEGKGECTTCLVKATCKIICPGFTLDQAVNNGELGFFRGMKFCEEHNKNFVIKTDDPMKSILFTPHYYVFGYLKSDKPEVDKILAKQAKENKDVEVPKELSEEGT